MSEVSWSGSLRDLHVPLARVKTAMQKAKMRRGPGGHQRPRPEATGLGNHGRCSSGRGGFAACPRDVLSLWVERFSPSAFEPLDRCSRGATGIPAVSHETPSRPPRLVPSCFGISPPPLTRLAPYRPVRARNGIATFGHRGQVTTIQHILSVPKHVKMRNPKPPPDFWEGDIVSRVGILDEGDSGERDFFRVMDEIKYNDGTRRIRLGYYWKEHDATGGSWIWGSQDTFTATKDLFADLVRQGRGKGML